eukprot:265684-Rhodomonas_salina.2
MPASRLPRSRGQRWKDRRGLLSGDPGSLLCEESGTGGSKTRMLRPKTSPRQTASGGGCKVRLLFLFPEL